MQETRKNILCVDDDPDMLNYLKAVLEANGYNTLLATSSEEAKKLCKEHTPDLIIVDLMMEEVDSGTELIKHLRAFGHMVPIYMLSSVGDSLSAITDYSSLGLTGVLQKPLNSDTLLRILKTNLS